MVAVSLIAFSSKAGFMPMHPEAISMRSKLKKTSASSLFRMPLFANRSHSVKFSSQYPNSMLKHRSTVW